MSRNQNSGRASQTQEEVIMAEPAFEFLPDNGMWLGSVTIDSNTYYAFEDTYEKADTLINEYIDSYDEEQA